MWRGNESWVAAHAAHWLLLTLSFHHCLAWNPGLGHQLHLLPGADRHKATCHDVWLPFAPFLPVFHSCALASLQSHVLLSCLCWSLSSNLMQHSTDKPAVFAFVLNHFPTLWPTVSGRYHPKQTSLLLLLWLVFILKPLRFFCYLQVGTSHSKQTYPHFDLFLSRLLYLIHISPMQHEIQN